MLEFLVDVVDAKLLEAVLFEDLEAVNVQHGECGEVGCCGVQAVVHPRDDLIKQAAVQTLRERITAIGSISGIEGHVVDRGAAAA